MRIARPVRLKWWLLLAVAAVSVVACQTVLGRKNDAAEPIPPQQYVRLLGKGMNVDWAKTSRGISFYHKQAVRDFKSRGLGHVRIRIKNDPDENFLVHLDRVVDDCLSAGLIPILAYQGKGFKDSPDSTHLEQAVNWWRVVAQRYRHHSYLLSFDLLIEVSDALSEQTQVLNEFYRRAVTAIREVSPHRIIFISPSHRSNPYYLSELKIPDQHNGFLMAEWHFYASGPSRTNPEKLWTTGTESEKNLIRDKIEQAVAWQEETGILTWVGAWMPGNYNKGDDYSIEEQIEFATFLTCQLDRNSIPFAINADTKFYNRETNTWVQEREPVLNAILHPDCAETDDDR
ncbi:MAG TPA: hypothetical protein ENJ89_07185 [Caldithrix abyssi]|uniref:Glycoside hydrolase family 5 domain-containing protein n=1 Tax=Caldithrix abyssi TaxID=187145 RepID=A0A7V5UF24_CALAY|nr:hypothetical protein [Caldithrix abyssi]